MSQATLTAKVGANVLTKVTRLFDGSPTTIFNELVQNSRRAGSQKIEVTLTDGIDTEVTFRDYGVGVTNLEQILTLTDSGWQEPTISDEDPAGMGIFVLSSLKDPVTLRSNGNEWTLTPKVFQGREQATVREIAFAQGLEVCFTLRNIGRSQVGTLLEAAVRYANIDEVTINGILTASQRYVEDADLRAEDRDLGVRFSLRPTYSRYAPTLKCGFHGLLVKSDIKDFTLLDMCKVLEIDLCLEILHSRNIKLVLPARNALVTEGLEDLWKWLTARVFEYVATFKGHKLPYAYGRLAPDHGVVLPPLNRLTALRYWPGSNEYELSSDLRKKRPVAIVKLDPDMRELVSASQLLSALKDGSYLYAIGNDVAFSGYPEYDQLPRLEAFVVYPEGNTIEGDIRIVDELRLVIKNQDGDEVHGVDLEAVFTGDEYPGSYIDSDFGTVVQKDRLDPLRLASLFEEYAYEYGGDSDDKSDEELRTAFSKSAEQHFFSFLMSPEDAMKHAVTEALDDLLVPSWNHGAAWKDTLTIRVERVMTPGPYRPVNSIKATFEIDEK
jgi:hypothetical protein